MNDAILREIGEEQLKKDITPFKVGDEIEVALHIKEGDKSRIQKFTGIVISRRGIGISESFTVRRVSEGYGVERVFPLHSPNIAAIKVTKESVVLDRAKMYYIRKRIGKAASQVREKRFFAKK